MSTSEATEFVVPEVVFVRESGFVGSDDPLASVAEFPEQDSMAFEAKLLAIQMDIFPSTQGFVALGTTEMIIVPGFPVGFGVLPCEDQLVTPTTTREVGVPEVTSAQIFPVLKEIQ